MPICQKNNKNCAPNFHEIKYENGNKNTFHRKNKGDCKLKKGKLKTRMKA